LRDDQGGVLVKGAAHEEHKNKTRTIWQAKNGVARESFLTYCFKMVLVMRRSFARSDAILRPAAHFFLQLVRHYTI
jgi:hypothetical protein